MDEWNLHFSLTVAANRRQKLIQDELAIAREEEIQNARRDRTVTRYATHPSPIAIHKDWFKICVANSDEDVESAQDSE